MTARIVTTELSPNEHLLLAREAAADSYRAGGYVYDDRQIRAAFSAGWDAHAEYVRQQLPQVAEGAFVSCWICHGEHELGVKFCSVLSRVV